MYAVLKSFGLKGLNGFPVEVEADISGGMPALSIVGLPDSAVRVRHNFLSESIILEGM